MMHETETGPWFLPPRLFIKSNKLFSTLILRRLRNRPYRQNNTNSQF